MNKRNIFYFFASIPAGYLPIVYIFVVFYFLVELSITGNFNGDKNSILYFVGLSGIYLTYVQWPIYILWVILSKELTLRLQILWVVIIILLNMFAIPFFLYCKYKKITEVVLIKNITNEKIKAFLSKGTNVI